MWLGSAALSSSDPLTEGTPSANHTERRGGQRPRLIVLHYTGMKDAAAARARLCDPQAQVSAHWLLYPDGIAELLVPESRRAWHAGAGSWLGHPDVNSHSIGVEIVNPGDQPFPARQFTGLEKLLRGVMGRWNIPAKAVIAHSDLAPARKSDPGKRFDWRRLALHDLAVWPKAPGLDVPLATSLTQIGYPECDPQARLDAFRLRFRPWATGPESEMDRRIASAVPR